MRNAAIRRLIYIWLSQSLRLFPSLIPAQFASPAKPAVLLIRAIKPSYTAGTLYEIRAKLV